MPTFKFLTAVFLAVCLTPGVSRGADTEAAAVASGLRIQSFDQVRTWWQAASFVSGAGYSTARERLGTQGFTFGAGVRSVTPDTFINVHILVIDPLGWPLSPTERLLVEAFVARGGAVLEARNWPEPLFSIADTGYFSGVAALAFDNLARSDVAAIASGVSVPVASGAHSVIAPGGGLAFLADNDGSGRAAGVLLPPSATRRGRLVVIGDEEVFMNYFPPEVPGSACGAYPNNQQLLSNVMNYLAGAPGLSWNGLWALRVVSIWASIREMFGLAPADAAVAPANDTRVPDGIVNSLLTKLENVAASLDAGELDEAHNQLRAFINEVRAQRGKHLSEAQADTLIEAAELVFRI